MLKTILLFAILGSTLLATMTNKYPSQQILDSNIPIVDIRTPPEWVETGVVKGAITIMFFNERGGFDIKGFLKELNEKVDTSKPFALICRTGSRTKMVSAFLSKELNYNVINLKGGMVYLMGMKLPTVAYKK